MWFSVAIAAYARIFWWAIRHLQQQLLAELKAELRVHAVQLQHQHVRFLAEPRQQQADLQAELRQQYADLRAELRQLAGRLEKMEQQLRRRHPARKKGYVRAVLAGAHT
ncbi:hypothetical protein MNEG_7880 [Monoraphidium neglectum]|uniref:Transmembrane protein n=1 Tax=Monoraphidium neglectum TaxID=145388 RepID=A0A0D2JLH9_9CHLO|nr:hypothetical protein MNEG_7880 [Monoraphidium neglectum]KIZ00083.1 hypothetical protein MNEG_7880 [Monoraphidium neglectum]|eukprot:XP_013899102.1 hypothetical protein MNEG_7880 [Monoraphidium neglectum]